MCTGATTHDNAKPAQTKKETGRKEGRRRKMKTSKRQGEHKHANQNTKKADRRGGVTNRTVWKREYVQRQGEELERGEERREKEGSVLVGDCAIGVVHTATRWKRQHHPRIVQPAFVKGIDKLWLAVAVAVVVVNMCRRSNGEVGEGMMGKNVRIGVETHWQKRQEGRKDMLIWKESTHSHTHEHMRTTCMYAPMSSPCRLWR